MENRLAVNVSSPKKAYTLKSVYITMISMYIPLLGIICIIFFNKKAELNSGFVLMSTLVFTIFATGVAFALRKKQA